MTPIPAVAMAVNSRDNRLDGESQTFAVGFNTKGSGLDAGREMAPTRRVGASGGGVPAGVAFSNRGHGSGNVMETVRAVPHGANPMVLAFDLAQITSAANYSNPKPGQPSPPRAATGQPHIAETVRSHPRPGSNAMGALTLARRGRDGGADLEWRDDDTYNALRSGDGGSSRQSGIGAPEGSGYAVRRLTPRECERLQGFPDDWTAVDADGHEIAGTHRYKQLGNAVAVPVVEWLARCLMAVLEVNP